MINQMYALRRKMMISGSAQTSIGSLAAGTIVHIKESNVASDFLILCHDYPQTGLTMLMKNDSAGKMAYASNTYTAVYGYESSQVDSWLNGTYLQRFDSATQNKIQTGSIATHTPKRTSPYTVEAKNISRKVFLLSATEVTGQTTNAEGTRIPYFTSQSLLPVTNVLTRQAYSFSSSSQNKISYIYGENYSSTYSQHQETHNITPSDANYNLLPCFCVLKTAVVDNGRNLVV